MRTVEAESSTQQIWKSDKRVVRVCIWYYSAYNANKIQSKISAKNFNIGEGGFDYALEPVAFAQLTLDLAVLFLKKMIMTS